MSDPAAPVVHVAGSGNIGNQMIRAMAAVTIADQVENCLLSGLKIPEWGLDWPDIAHLHGRVEVRHGDREMNLNPAGIISRMRRGDLDRFEFALYAQHINNFLPPERYRRLHWPGLLRAADLLRPVTVDSLIDRQTDLALHACLDRIAKPAPAGEIATWTL